MEYFADLNGLNQLTAFLGQERQWALPNSSSPFPEREKAKQLFNILNYVNPKVFKFAYEALLESKLVAYINFTAMFPLSRCPCQEIRLEA